MESRRKQTLANLDQNFEREDEGNRGETTWVKVVLVWRKWGSR